VQGLRQRPATKAGPPGRQRGWLPGRLRGRLALAAGLAAAALLLGLPGPKQPATAPADPVRAGSGAPALPGVADVWPSARPFGIPATLTDGSAYSALVVVDANTTIGQATSPDGLRSTLVVVPATGAVRPLQSHLVNDGGSFDGITVTPDRLYWMHTVSDADGHATASLWTADRSGGVPRQLTADVGQPLFYGSAYDVQLVDGRLYWTAARPGRPDQTELRSVAAGGGPVTVRVLDGPWAMTAWPWLDTAANAIGAPMRLFDLTSGATVEARVPASRQVSCGRAWCRIIPAGGTGDGETDLVRPDGSDLRRIGGATATPIASDVALRDRFEVLLSTVASNATTTVSRLTVYDIAHRREVLLSPAATSAAARGDFVWWSTGDQETLAWHGLDLRTLD